MSTSRRPPSDRNTLEEPGRPATAIPCVTHGVFSNASGPVPCAIPPATRTLPDVALAGAAMITADDIMEVSTLRLQTPSIHPRRGPERPSSSAYLHARDVPRTVFRP